MSENHWFSDVFRGFRNGTFAENGSIEFIPSMTYQEKISIYLSVYIIYIYIYIVDVIV